MHDEQIRVSDTVVVETVHTTLEDGHRCALVRIALESVRFAAGQFMMVKTCDAPVRWGYPYSIQSTDGASVTVLASENSDLYRQPAGAAVAAWGPRGKGPLPEQGAFVLVAEPATYGFVSTFVHNHADRCSLVLMLGGGASHAGQPMERHVNAAYPYDMEALCTALEGMSETVVAALNPHHMQLFGQLASDELSARTHMHVPTKIGCGIGGCTGCVIHSPTSDVGIKICEEGPFLPFPRIDIETDLACFVTVL